MRRDFTVNALCQTLDGRVIDITETGTGRSPRPGAAHAARPRESRSPRTRCGCTARRVSWLSSASRWRPGTVEAMRAQAGRTSILSVERITDELRRMLSVAAIPAPASTSCVRPDCSSTCSRSSSPAIGVEQGGFHTHDVYDHTVAARRRRAERPRHPHGGAAPRHREAGDPRGRADGQAHLLRPRAGRRGHGARHPHPLALQQRRDRRGEPVGAAPPPPDPVRAREVQRHGGAAADRRRRRSARAAARVSRAPTRWRRRSHPRRARRARGAHEPARRGGRGVGDARPADRRRADGRSPGAARAPGWAG